MNQRYNITRIGITSRLLITIFVVFALCGPSTAFAMYLLHHLQTNGPTGWQYFPYTGKIEATTQEGHASWVPILMYHGIVEEPDNVNTTIDRFVEQMETLKAAGYETITLDEYYRFRRGELELPAKPFIITFDDGRKDSYYNSDNILKSLGFEATMFLITDLMAQEGDHFFLSWDEARKMRDSGRWELEAHGHNSHQYVDGGYYLATKMQGEDDQEYARRVENDYVTCIRMMEQNLGAQPHFYAVPFGDFGIYLSESPCAIAMDVNLSCATKYFDLVLGLEPTDEWFNTANSSPYKISRIHVRDLTGWELLEIMNSEPEPSSEIIPTEDMPISPAIDMVVNEQEETWTNTQTSSETRPSPIPTRTIFFAGYEWQVRSGYGYPGPNTYGEDNVWVDENGRLHLRITRVGNTWYCAEMQTVERFGFGEYQFQVIGQIDQLDPYVVLGLTSYPDSSRPEGTDEIDIEFSRWGGPEYYNGSYGVWGTQPGSGQMLREFMFHLDGLYSTHRYLWDGKQVIFQSLNGHTDGNQGQVALWRFAPGDYEQYIAQQPMPVLINLWLFDGHAPTNRQEVEIIISDFKFTPDTSGTMVIAPNSNPVVSAGPDVTIAEGGVFFTTGTFTDPDTDAWRATVNYGDGSAIETLWLSPSKNFSLGHRYVDNGTYIVTVTVTDDAGGVGTDVVTVTVVNIVPAVQAGNDQTVSEGASVTFLGAFTDPGADSATIEWNFGDGTLVSGTLTPTHTYADNGTFLVTLTVTDDDGGVGVDSVVITVTNISPAVSAGGNVILPSGELSIIGSFSDPGTDTWIATVDYGDNSGVHTLTLNSDKTFTLNHTYVVPGNYLVTVTVADDDGGVGTDTVNITVLG